MFDVENLEYDKTWACNGKDYFTENYSHDWEKINEPHMLDAVLFLNSQGVAYHAGIVFENRRFIHASRAGVIVSRLDDMSWKNKIENFYRLKI